MSDDPRDKRVTLKFETVPLRLPGEPKKDEVADDSGELRLPDADQLDGIPEKPVVRPSGTGRRVRDGWERQRRSATPPPTEYAVTVEVPPTRALKEEGDALSLVDTRSRPSVPGFDIPAEMADRFALGDFSAALRLAELILGNDPEDADARATSERSKRKLALLYTSRLGSTERVLHPSVDGAEVRWLGLDHRAGFVFSLVDGQHSVSELIDMSGMPSLEVLKTLVELLEMGAVRLPE